MALVAHGYDVTINDKARGKPEGWKKGSFIVVVKTLDGARSEPVRFIGLARPFQDLRDCEVDAEVVRSLQHQ